MAGLLDGIDPQTALLLGLGSGLLGTTGQGRRASFGEALANGMQAGTQGYRQAISDRQRAQQIAAEQAAREQQMMLAREQMLLAKANAQRDAQLFPGQLQAQKLGNDRSQAELDAQQAAQRQAAQMRAVLASLAGGGGGGSSVMAGPTLDGPAEPVAMPGGGGSSSPEDYKKQIIRLVQSGQLPPAQGEALIKASDYGRQEVARTIETTGAGGVPMVRQVDKFGGTVGNDMPKPYERRFQDFGGTISGLDPYTGQPMGAAMPKSMTPGEVASNAVARGNLGVAQANLGLSRQRLDLERQQAGGLTYIPDVGWAPKTIRPGEQPTVVPLPGGGIGKPPTEGQGKALLFGSRMKGADAKITQLEKSGTMSGSRIQQGAEAVPWVGGALGMAANSLASQSQQEYTQAKRDFVTAVLRRESGATIQPSEFSTADLMYFPQPGDGPKVIEQKQQLRKRATDALLYEAGPHAAQADRLAQPQPSATQHSASGAIRPAQPGTVLRFDAQGNMIGN